MEQDEQAQVDGEPIFRASFLKQLLYCLQHSGLQRFEDVDSQNNLNLGTHHGRERNVAPIVSLSVVVLDADAELFFAADAVGARSVAHCIPQLEGIV